MIRVNGKLIKGSEEDFKKAKRVTDINYPIERQIAELKGLKPRNVDEVEDNALRLLKIIKQKDPVDAEDLEKAIVPQPRETNKTCTQTKAQIEHILLADYGSENKSPPILNMKKWEKEIEEYIELSFIEWGWHTNEEHETYMETLEEKIQNGSTPAEERERLKVYARALYLERAMFRKNVSKMFPTSSSSPRRQ
jgi:hypothetical protein